MKLLALLIAGVACAALVFACARIVPPWWRRLLAAVTLRAEKIAPLTFFLHPGYVAALLALAPTVVVAAVVVWFLIAPVWGVLTLAMAGMLGFARLAKKEEKLQETVRRLLPDVVEAVAMNAKARSSIPTAFEEASASATSPLREILADVVQSYKRGVVFHEALLMTAARVRCRELNLAFDVASVCFKQGSPLDEVSRRLATSLRSLHAFRTKIQNETSGARMGMRIMMILPVAVLLMMAGAEPEAVSMMFEKAAGMFMLVFSGILLFIAWRWGRSILRSYL